MFGYLLKSKNPGEAVRQMMTRSFLAAGLLVVAILAIAAFYFFGVETP